MQFAEKLIKIIDILDFANIRVNNDIFIFYFFIQCIKHGVIAINSNNKCEFVNINLLIIINY